VILGSVRDISLDLDRDLALIWGLGAPYVFGAATRFREISYFPPPPLVVFSISSLKDGRDVYPEPIAKRAPPIDLYFWPRATKSLNRCQSGIRLSNIPPAGEPDVRSDDTHRTPLPQNLSPPPSSGPYQPVSKFRVLQRASLLEVTL